MFVQAVLKALNHVLASEAWARERLRPYAGQHLRLQGGPLALELAVDGQGYLERRTTEANGEPAVTVELPADTPFRLLSGRDAVFGAARLSGSADFAETLAFVFRNLRWDIEDDLSKVIGDVGAHRLVRAGKGILAWQRQAGTNLVANVGEYLGEETELLVPRPEVERFVAELRLASEELAKLEQRLNRL